MGRRAIFLFAICILVAGSAFASTVSRSFSATTVAPNADVTITLAVSITGNETYYAIDETLPSNWTIKNKGTADNNQLGHLKWVVFQGAASTSYNYVLAAPAQAGTTTFAGKYMLEGMASEATITGSTQVTVTTSNPCSGKADLTSCGTNLYCCAQTCVGTPTGCTGCKNTSYTCSGASLVCGNAPSGTACTADTNSCSSDVCNGSGTCTHPPAPSGTVCGTIACPDGYCGLNFPWTYPASCNKTCNATGGCQTCSCSATAGASCGFLSYCYKATGVQNPSCTACATGFGNCDSNSANGCELSLTANKNNCGSCGNVCGAGQNCCNGSCSTPACSNNTACNDNNAASKDVCNDLGSCTAACTHTPITQCGLTSDGYCPSGCTSLTDSDCIASCGNGVVDVNENCLNCPGDVTCDTGKSCCNGSCITPLCLKNSDCGLGHICLTPGTCTANCAIGCQTGNDCLPDQQCCDNSCIIPACASDANCNDQNSATMDTCNNVGSCTAVCTNTLITQCVSNDSYCPDGCAAANDSDCISTCGNGIIDVGETCGNCAQDVVCSQGSLCCSDACIAPACSDSSQCNDNNPCTNDSCDNGGSCTASCSHAAIPGCGSASTGGSGGGGGGGGGGGSWSKLFVTINGSCIGQPVIVSVVDRQLVPVIEAKVNVSLDKNSVVVLKTNAQGKVVVTLSKLGDYLFNTTKTGFYDDSQKVKFKSCAAPVVNFSANIEIGKTQIISLKAGDGNVVSDFNVLVTYPDKTVKTVVAVNGVVSLPVNTPGTYTAVVQAGDYSQSFNFVAKKSLQVVPDIKPDAKPVVAAVFGKETVETPNYVLLWLLAITVISGTIIVLTRLRPVWFRIFLASTYSTVPFVVNLYYKNIWLAMTITGIETLILNYLLYTQWKRAKIQAKAAAAQKTLSADIPELPPKPPQAPPTLLAKKQQKTNKI